MRRIVALAILLIGTAARAASPDPCSLSSTVADSKVTIAIPDGRISFQEGEIIPLVLTFTSTADKRYWADDRRYDRSGRLNIEVYCIEPEAPDPLADYFRAGAFIGGGLGNTRQLSEAPFTATAELNEWRQPRAGRYQLHVVSCRVWRLPDPGEATPYGHVSVTLRSNTIEFEITKADAGWAEKQLQEATEAYRDAKDDAQKRAARELRFLNTKSSLDTLAKLFWGLNDQPEGWDLMFGVFGSPYRSEAIAALQREIGRPDHPITLDYLRTLTHLQIGADSSWDPPENDPAHPEVVQEYWLKRQAHERELMRAAIAATAAALPKKTGHARALTIEALAESSNLLDAATASQIHKQLIAAWFDLPETTRKVLIQYRWPLIANPDMLPILKEFVSAPAPPGRTLDATARDAALEHIYELSPAEGRSLILREFRDSNAEPSLSLAKFLSADDLQPIVQEAAARIEKNSPRLLDFHLVERYGNTSMLARMETVFNGRVGQWACDPQAAMLRYFLNFDPELGAKEAEASLASRNSTGCYRFLFQQLGDELPQVEPLAIGALNDADLEVANDAALALGRWGTAAAEKTLWARLERFHEEWRGREGDLRSAPPYLDPVSRATALEGTLVNSIATGTNWLCGPEKLTQLSAVASPRQQMQVESWKKMWTESEELIAPNWFPEDQLSFGVLQYSNLDEQQFKEKLSQLPRSTKLLFQIWLPGQISPPVSVEKQDTVFQAMRAHAAKFGVTVEKTGGR